VAGVAGDEHARQTFRDLPLRHVIELVAKALADLIDRPPRNFFHVERIGLENALRRRDQIVGRDVAIGNPFAGIELVPFAIEPEKIATLRGMMMLLPSVADCINDLKRISGKSVMAKRP
jgi:hypothetical protein